MEGEVFCSHSIETHSSDGLDFTCNTFAKISICGLIEFLNLFTIIAFHNALFLMKELILQHRKWGDRLTLVEFTTLAMLSVILKQ